MRGPYNVGHTMTRRVVEPVEVLYMSLMERWANTAPPHGKRALLDGRPATNSQTERLAFVLRKIALGPKAESFYNGMTRDTRPLISRKPADLDNARELSDGWFLDQTMLGRKMRIHWPTAEHRYVGAVC